MKFIDEYNFDNLIDEGQRLVIEELGRQLGSWPAEICKCNDCVVDMCASALNALPPRYHASLIGRIYQSDSAALDDRYSRSLKKAVRSAIEKVSGNPSHE